MVIITPFYNPVLDLLLFKVDATFLVCVLVLFCLVVIRCINFFVCTIPCLNVQIQKQEWEFMVLIEEKRWLAKEFEIMPNKVKEGIQMGRREIVGSFSLNQEV